MYLSVAFYSLLIVQYYGVLILIVMDVPLGELIL